MIDFYPFIKKYKEYMQLLNRSPLTIKQHLFHLNRFVIFLKDYSLNDIQEIHCEHLKEYQKHRYHYLNRYNKQDDVITQNKSIATLKSFFAFLKKEEYILSDPSVHIEYAKEPRRLPQAALNNTEMKRILNSPNTHTLTGYRDRTLLELLYSTGIRKSELIHLKIEDVDYHEGYLRINQGKGDKDRVLPIGKIACQYLETYIKGIRPLLNFKKEENILFLSQRGRELGKSTLDELIKKHARRSGLDKPVSTHTFRRSCATEMIKNKANLMHVKELLGHQSMETIQSYCSLAIQDLKEEHKKHHPRERDVV